MKQGYLPNKWRIHKIIPIYKSGDKSSVKNYHPISLLCCISKVLESIIYDWIYDTISSHISTNQFGFLKKSNIFQNFWQRSRSEFVIRPLLVTSHPKLLQKAYGSFLLIRCTFPPESTPTHIKKHLYLALILPLLTYASPVWRPKLLNDIIALESFQRCATRYILNYPKSTDYKSRLTALQILPIMYRLELNDIMFYVTSKKNPSPHFNISDYISEHSSSIFTRTQSAFKLIHMHSLTNTNHHLYFNRLPRLWNSLPPLNPNLSISTIKFKIVRHLIDHFLNHFDSYNPCTFHLLRPCNSCSSLPLRTTFTE